MLLPAALDLGTGAPGETLTGAVVIRNTGGSPLQISKLRPGCSCLFVQLSAATIPAGDTATLTITGRMKPKGEPLSFGVFIASNDPSQPETVVPVQAAPAPPPIRPEEAEIDFGAVPLGASPQKSLPMRRPDDKTTFASDCRLDLQTPPVVVDAQVRAEEEGPGRSFRLLVSPRKDLPLGPFEDNLRLVFHDAGGDHGLTVPVRGTVTRLVIASPTTVYFDDAQAADGVQRVVVVRRTDEQDLAAIRRIEAPAAVQAEEEGQDGAKTCRRVHLTLDRGKAVPDDWQADLRIWIEGEDEPLIVHMNAPRHTRS